MMLKQVSESLAGRVGIIELSPLTLYEHSKKVQNQPSSWLETYLTRPEQNSESYCA